MNAPRPSVHHATLARLVGTWHGHERELPSPWAPQGGQGEGTLCFRLACGDRFVVSDYEQLREGVAGFTGHGVYGWDESEGCFTMHWADSMASSGFLRAIRGRLTDAGLVFETESLPRMRYRYAFPSCDVLEFCIESSADGMSWSPLFEGRYARS